MSKWFTVSTGLGTSRAPLLFLAAFRRAVADGRLSQRMLQELARPGGLVTQFFERMFEARGTGALFAGRGWKPISAKWEAFKRKRGLDLRIGHMKGRFRRSLTQPGAPGNIKRLRRGVLVYGSRIESKGKPYGVMFNEGRPVIDEAMRQEFLWFVLAGPGRAEFTRLVLRLKASLVQRGFAESGLL